MSLTKQSANATFGLKVRKNDVCDRNRISMEGVVLRGTFVEVESTLRSFFVMNVRGRILSYHGPRV